MPVIEVHRLVKRYGSRSVLRQIDISVDEGEFVALIGPNGAGKTTLIRILSSLVRPTLGTVQISGYALPHQSAAVRRRLGVVSHLPLVYGDLSAEENLEFYGRLYDVANLKTRTAAVLALVGLDARRRDLVRTFSRGMQQRLAIGRALLHQPDVLLLDEPHTGLDQDACQMLDRVLMEVSERGQTIVMTSHDLARAAELASRFDVLTRGQIVASVPSGALPEGGLQAFYRQALDYSDSGNARL